MRTRMCKLSMGCTDSIHLHGLLSIELIGGRANVIGIERFDCDGEEQ